MTDLGEDTTSNLTSKVVDSVHFAGQRVDTVEGRGLFVEDKDWKLIKAKLDMSSKRGVNGERLWGGHANQQGGCFGSVGPEDLRGRFPQCLDSTWNRSHRLMPTRPQARCTFTGCNRKAAHQGRCDQHQRKPWQNPSAHTRALRQHHTEWMHVRAERLKLEPNCRRCNRKGTNVDHIIPVGAGGAFLDINNTQTLCDQCKTLKDQEDRRNYPRIFH